MTRLNDTVHVQHFGLSKRTTALFTAVQISGTPILSIVAAGQRVRPTIHASPREIFYRRAQMPHHSGSKQPLGVLSILALTHPRCALYVPIIVFRGRWRPYTNGFCTCSSRFVFILRHASYSTRQGAKQSIRYLEKTGTKPLARASRSTRESTFGAFYDFQQHRFRCTLLLPVSPLHFFPCLSYIFSSARVRNSDLVTQIGRIGNG